MAISIDSISPAALRWFQYAIVSPKTLLAWISRPRAGTPNPKNSPKLVMATISFLGGTYDLLAAAGLNACQYPAAAAPPAMRWPKPNIRRRVSGHPVSYAFLADTS